MEEQAITPTKRATRNRKTASTPLESSSSPSILKADSDVLDVFSELVNKITAGKQEFEHLQRQMAETKLEWEKRQKEYETEQIALRTQKDLERKREEESYLYELNRKRKLSEDEFNDKKAAWEKELRESQGQTKKNLAELEELRQLAANFEAEKNLAVKTATDQLAVELKKQFEFDKKMSEQEYKAEKEVLGIKISNLTAENTRQAKEIEQLKKSLDEANDQVKEIALKVIESRKPAFSPPAPEKSA